MSAVPAPSERFNFAAHLLAMNAGRPDGQGRLADLPKAPTGEIQRFRLREMPR